MPGKSAHGGRKADIRDCEGRQRTDKQGDRADEQLQERRVGGSGPPGAESGEHEPCITGGNEQTKCHTYDADDQALGE